MVLTREKEEESHLRSLSAGNGLLAYSRLVRMLHASQVIECARQYHDKAGLVVGTEMVRESYL